jgi:hypothetical protein
MKIMKASRFYDVAERGYILTTKKWIVDVTHRRHSKVLLQRR